MESSRKVVIQALIGWVLLLGLISGAACQSAWVNPHNTARSIVGVANIIWSPTLASFAAQWANDLASRGCPLQHRPNNPYGENIFWASWSSTPADAVNAWVGEKIYYNYATNTCAAGQICGHYTQVVWRKSIEVGCASAACPNNGGTISVCNYNPPGNYVGQKPY
ncbi:pathogenesis-related protein 1 [Marchantia polymorpha subsp. ruderalis]|uniref:SCP domain-containing protein n=2 Tax=Marchantia polymorpha TaxID=3197 RepID=A0A176VNA0_MARPO|nr:hypothetical protein AXG93_2318s1060 [Marchantia polymorpha subsp. ruderalis]PTQ41167.1 hypothetical protein MARPO_0036s0139 [Marchantia polymorpha]BBM97866.1 hypothetical protein Mp_1g08990 [Marchantia polymorpha subsp. ruderalis]|eukprot:PTQ41167.1 hypothetical protein MARPO_0036s0139 [Marchantia polymorpha]